MNKDTLFSTLSAAVLASALIAGPAASAQTKLRIAGNFPVDHTASKVMERFKADVEKNSKGELQIDLFPAMQLGGAGENVDQVRSGTIFAVVTSIAYFSRAVPEFEAVSLPFLFDTREKAYRVIDGPVGQIFADKMAAKGFKSLGFGELGFRNVTNSVRPLKTVEDFKGLKIRLQPNEVHLDTFRALRANPVAMDIKEVYSALQQGVLDGHENPYNIIYPRRFFEVQKYLSDSGHFYDFINAAANKRQFEKLSPANQKIVVQAMNDAMLWQRAEAAKLDEHWKNELIKAGMIFTPIPAETRAALREATAGVVDTVKQRVDPALIDQVLEAIKN